MKNFFRLTYLASLALLISTTSCNKNNPLTLTIMGESEVSKITSNSAVVTGTTIEIGENMQAYGHVWGETEMPEITSNLKSEHKGTEAGSFKDELSGLKAGTKYYVRAYAKDGEDIIYIDAVSFTTLAELKILSVITNEVTDIQYMNATCGGTVTNEGESAVIVRGVCWSTTENPTVDDFKTEDGTAEISTFTSYLESLTVNTTYYVRAYAINAEDTAYGEQKTFSTLAYSVPTITTNEVTATSSGSAVCGGNVTSDGGYAVTERGICRSTSENPTIDDINDFKTSDGSGTGDFTSNLIDLTYSTTYYVRAYATNNIGTAYGEQKSFTTNALKIGDFFAGGVIFYLNAENDGGLVCTVSNVDGGSGAEWGCGGTEIGAFGTEIGTGSQNTEDIETDCTTEDTAADLCAKLNLNGYTDWFLPSQDELDSMYVNKALIDATATANGGSEFASSFYWSSSETNNVQAKSQNFNGGGYGEATAKSFIQYVRAVRAF